jgi:phosphoenolpyruvate carboxykinase (GTP)
VYEARSWQHGVLIGASVASETTAAATGAVGVVRRDPMAMKPFAGYNYGAYWRHWLDVGRKLGHPPKLFHVNWFRRDAAGKFLWPGYGDNLRVMEWIIKRCTGAVGADESPIGQLPRLADLNLAGTNVGDATMKELLAVQRDAWRKEAADMRGYLEEFGARAPAEMSAELDEIERRLG